MRDSPHSVMGTVPIAQRGLSLCAGFGAILVRMFSGFRPRQYIDTSQIHRDISYREYVPDPFVRQFVACYWSVVSYGAVQDVSHRVLSDGCMDIICDLDAGYGFMAGIADSSEMLLLQGRVCSFGIRFLPHSIPENRSIVYIFATLPSVSPPKATPVMSISNSR